MDLSILQMVVIAAAAYVFGFIQKKLPFVENELIPLLNVLLATALAHYLELSSGEMVQVITATAGATGVHRAKKITQLMVKNARNKRKEERTYKP